MLTWPELEQKVFDGASCTSKEAYEQVTRLKSSLFFINRLVTVA